MSGMVGIVNADGRPVDQRLLAAMTRSLRFRGPDAERVWAEENAGLGHTLFATTEEASTECQPCTLDDEVWITADARIDGREDLIRDLATRGHVIHQANDAELLLHAYAAWGDACVDHLLGDFAFAIWNRRTKRLFCARDHFGVKPFFYSHCGGSLVFSNTLDCVRRHPAVSDELDELTIADYLLFYYKQDLQATVYADVRRLPAAHVLSWEKGVLRTRRYWSLTQKDEIRYRRASDYVDHFNSLLGTAVSDRLRTRKVGIVMSGGLDSPSVAAAAKATLSKQGTPFNLRAYTIVFDQLIPDRERYYAGLVAKHLHIPIHYVLGDHYQPYQRSNEPDLRTPEPMDEPHMALYHDLYRLAAANGRVALTGSDGDSVLIDWPKAHVTALLKSGRFGRLAGDLLRSLWLQRRLPRVGLRASLKRWNRPKRRAEEPRPMPAWLNRGFIERCRLEERCKDRVTGEPPPPAHSLRPRFSKVMSAGLWAQLFEGEDPGVTRLQIELRHPYADLRLIHYLLAIPLIPWCDDKTIVRVAMRGLLPDQVRTRPKSPMAVHPIVALLQNGETRWVDSFQSVPDLQKYVDRRFIPSVTGTSASVDALDHLRPFSLNQWMRSRTSTVCEGDNDVEQASHSVA